uniref:Uncharacterized protein n=1 Tax=Aegilops tauschii subsp. strangulata TaxID=200361 RepID=A0A453F788_AEGTS
MRRPTSHGRVLLFVFGDLLILRFHHCHYNTYEDNISKPKLRPVPRMSDPTIHHQ